MQIKTYKGKGKIKEENKRQKLNIIINKYDMTLDKEEKENELLRLRLNSLQKNI